ncbi:hypothetical protein GCHA_3230 [Paraglaciecola chathamensis S18K6]|uniref:Uncharacterized protein n=1 Tax=Paraglaciecola chathamensis S18K6 TaxID=1127672 RepID=A0AAV3UXQ8_9ALTE|nr:hypothetical protein GCHA_3230 [Paraglaciecola chathamensis S18K6]
MGSSRTGLSKLRVPQLTKSVSIAHALTFSKLRVPQLT